MVLLNIGLEHFAHHNTLYFLCLSSPFVMFLDVITKLDIWSNVNVLNCEISAECLLLTTLRFDFRIRVQVNRLNGVHRRLTPLCILHNALFAAHLQPDTDQRWCVNFLKDIWRRGSRGVIDKSRFHGIIWREIVTLTCFIQRAQLWH